MSPHRPCTLSEHQLRPWPAEGLAWPGLGRWCLATCHPGSSPLSLVRRSAQPTPSPPHGLGATALPLAPVTGLRFAASDRFLPDRQDERQEVCSSSSHSRSGLATLYGIYGPVAGSGRLTSGPGPVWRCTHGVLLTLRGAAPCHRLTTQPSPQKLTSPGAPYCPEGPALERVHFLPGHSQALVACF